MTVPAYVIVNVDVTDPERYEEYKAGTPESVTSHGGRFVVRGGDVEVWEGDPQLLGRLVVLEFPDADAARGWYRSEGYQRLKAIRESASTADMIMVEGF